MTHKSPRHPVREISNALPAPKRKHADRKPTRVALVTEELSFGIGSGGIGGAFHELSLALARAGYSVDLLYLPISPDHARDTKMFDYYLDHGVHVVIPGIDQYTWSPGCYGHRSYGIFRYISSLETPYNIVHFHDYKGLGFFSLAAKQQRLAFADTSLVVQAHGPTRWTLHANGHPFTHPDQLKIDFLERQSIARADVLISPSQYMLEWFRAQGWPVPPPEQVHVLQNICTHIRSLIVPVAADQAPRQFDEIVFFGRHEERKGIAQFCDALDLIGAELCRRGIAVSFLGAFGKVNGAESSVYLADRARRWSFPINVFPDLDRVSAARYLTGNPRALAVIPSPEENSPYTVLEAVVIGKPLITSDVGGARELLDEASVRRCTCSIQPQTLAARLREVIANGLAAPHAAFAPQDTEQRWVRLHEQLTGSKNIIAHHPSEPKYHRLDKSAIAHLSKAQPKVMAAITHFERPMKLYDAMLSLAGQSYPNIELVIVDDGSSSQETLIALTRMQPLMDKLKIRLIRQANRYLGAARNRAAEDTNSDYVLFLDDDDIAFPDLVQMLVIAAEATSADIVTCPNLYMPESRRFESYPFPDLFQQKISYIPLGGPLAMAPFENCFGAATALIRRTALLLLGGYTEDQGVGHEDFEFYVRALQAGLRIEVCPLPLYLYEVDRPSMASSTSRLRNATRVIRSIDLASCPQVWQDLVSVTAGSRAQEHAENFALYNRKAGPHANLLQQIADTPTDSAEYAARVGEYAAAIGASSFARAMKQLAIKRSMVGQTDTEEEMLLPGISNLPAVHQHSADGVDQHLLASLLHLSFGRIEESIRDFRLSTERGRGRLNQGHLRYLRVLCETPGLHPSVLRSMLQALRHKRTPPEIFKRGAATIFRLALIAREPGFGLSILDRAIAIEDQEYLAGNPDVADAVARGAFSSGLEHYERAGGKEGRPGFATLKEMRAVLGILLDTEPSLAALRQTVAHLKQNEVVSSSFENGAPEVAAVEAEQARLHRSHHNAMALESVT